MSAVPADLLMQRRELIERRRRIDQELRTVEGQLAALTFVPPKPPAPRRPLTVVVLEKMRREPLTVAELRGRIRRSTIGEDDPETALSRAVAKLVREGSIERHGNRYALIG